MARKSLKRTSAPLYPEHPPSEHQWRLHRARKIMKEDSLDALVLSRNPHVFYMTGSRFALDGFDARIGIAPQSCAVITQDADIYCKRLVAYDSDDIAIHTTLSESFELYDDELELVNILSDYGIRRGQRIGIEWGPRGLCTAINPLKFQKLQQLTQKELGAEFVDGTDTILRMMAIKSKLEIERMKVAVSAAAQAMERVLDCIEIGMNQLDVARMASMYMLEAGADRVGHAEVQTGQDGASLLSCDAVDTKLERGYHFLDFGSKYKRYWSDLGRGFFLGRKPTKEEIKLYECRLGMNELMDKTIKPGVCMDDVVAEIKHYVEKCGCVWKEKISGLLYAGHGIGVVTHQQPWIASSIGQPAFQNKEGKVLFEPGMMFTYEPFIGLPGGEYPFPHIEDDVVVTETGVENMSSMLSRELRVKL